MNDTTIKIDLKKSGDANAFDDQNQIHVREFESITHIIDEQIQTAKDDVNLTDKKFNNTIAVFGARGTGKTSFLKSVLKHYTEKKGNEIVVLNIIDPTEIEEKGHLFLLLISVINGMVSKQLEQGECKPNSTDYDKRKHWVVCLEKLSKGLPSLDNIGNKYDSDSWQSERYIMEMGLTSVKAAFDLESNFRKLIDIALDILDKKAILISFDDIDVDFRKGWQVLEVIRKYLKSPRIITIISGDYNLYSLNIRKQQFKYLGINANNANIVDHLQVKTLLNSLEYQYFIKVMPPDKMIMLKPIYANINAGIQYEVVNHGYLSDNINLEDFYKELLNRCGIYNPSDTVLLQNFLLSLPLRTQICMMKAFTGELSNLNVVKVFVNILHENSIDYSLAENSVQDCVSEIIKYLINNEIYTSCDLMPIEGDVIKSSCLFALLLMFSYYGNTNRYLFFDYGFRVCYINNILFDQKDFKLLTEFSIQYNHKSLKDLITYINIVENNKSGHPSNCIPLFGLANKSKRELDDRFDVLTKDLNIVTRIIINIPVIYHTYSSKNSSSLYYSPIALFACIGDLIEAYDKDMLLDKLYSYYNIEECSIDAHNRFLKTSLDYELRDDASEKHITNIKIDLDIREVINELYVDMRRWIESFRSFPKKDPNYAYSAQIVYRCFTNLYKVVDKVIKENDHCDDMMKYSIYSILNVILVEEMNSSRFRNFRNLFRSNDVITSDKVFFYNLKKVRDYHSALITKWLLCCPIILPFIDIKSEKYFEWIIPEYGLDFIKKYSIDTIKEKLHDLGIKHDVVESDNIIKFSGSARQYLNVRNYLNKHGFYDDYLINAEYNDFANTMSTLFTNKIQRDSFNSFQNHLKDYLHK